MIVKVIRDRIRLWAIELRKHFYIRFYGVHIHPTARISYGTIIDRSKKIYIGQYACMASGAVMLAHDYCRAYSAKTTLGDYSFVGVNAIIMPGVTVGNHCVVAAGAIVIHDVPDCCMVAGNPAVVVKTGIMTKKYGQLVTTDKSDKQNDGQSL